MLKTTTSQDFIILENFHDVLSLLDTDIKASVIALNLMYFSKYKNLHRKGVYLWLDGFTGAKFVQLKTKKNATKLPGSEFLKQLISSEKLKEVSVLGDCPLDFVKILEKSDIKLLSHYPLNNFDPNFIEVEDFKSLKGHVIISLPSPKQELLAEALYSGVGTVRVVFCLGGAIHMLADPSLECPKVLRQLNLEWLFRLKTDFRRRVMRLLTTFFMAIRNLSHLLKNISVSLYSEGKREQKDVDK